MNLGEILRILFFGFPVPSEMIDPNYPEFFQRIGGLQLTAVITILSLFLGAPLGLVLALFRTGRKQRHEASNKIREFYFSVRWIATILVEGVRAMPLIILVLLAFYLPFRLFGMRVPPVILAVGAFTLYGGVYLSEVFRSGFNAVDEGCIHAAKVLGLTRRQILMRIKLPIAIRAMVPTFLNLSITVFKDTSVLVVVAVPEITYSGRSLLVAMPASYSLVLFLIILIYWTLATTGSAMAHWLESKWGKTKEMLGGATLG